MKQGETSDFSARCSQWQEVAVRNGCVFENLGFLEDESGSVSVIAVQPDRPVELRIANAFIVNEEGIELTNHGQRVLPSHCPDEAVRAVLDDMLAYIMSPARLRGLRDLFIGFSSLPQPLRERLAAVGLVTQFFMPPTPEFLAAEGLPTSEFLSPWVEPDERTLRYRLLHYRVIFRSKQQKVFMPFVDFVNHDPFGLSYEVSDEDIGMHGSAAPSGEVFAVYNASDAWGLLDSYGFTGESRFAYSVAFELGMPDGTRLRISRRTGESLLDEGGLRLPTVDVEGQTIRLSHVWIGALGAPDRPFRSFTAVWEQLGRDDALAVFGQIVRYNWTLMRELRALVGALDTPAARLVRGSLSQHMRVLVEQRIG